MTPRPLRFAWAIAAGRAINALLFLFTSIYCLLTYSPFAYEQFIQPHVVAWLSTFVIAYPAFYWLGLCVTFLTLVPHLKASPHRGIAWAYVGVGAAVGLIITWTRVLPGGNQPERSLAVALISLVPIVWLAILDHLTAPPPAVTDVWNERRLAIAAALTGVFVWALYAAAAIVRLRGAGGSVGDRGPLVIGVAMSAVDHAAAFTLLLLALVAIDRLSQVSGSPFRTRAWCRGALAAIALTILLERVVLAPISLGGAAAWILSGAIALAVVLCVSGIARMQPAGNQPAMAAAVTLVLLPPIAVTVLAAVTTFDWGFMLQKLSALAVASVALVAVGALVRSRRLPADTSLVRFGPAGPVAVMVVFIAAAIVAPRLSAWRHDPRLDPQFALDVYSAGDPALRLLRQFLEADRSASADADFFAYLRANSSLQRDVKPVAIDFVDRFGPSPAAARPHIFFFLIDSLRRDYVSAYNPAVTFTPALQAFAADSFVFDRAFTRYGGTGLSVPSIWAGAMVAHKQYVTPFAPMNALGKLIDADGYRRVVTFDHITDELFGFPPGATMLDRTVPEMLHTLCGTVEEIEKDVKEHAGDPRPIFAHTRPLDLHIGNTRLAQVPAGESYPGFFAPYASHVRRIDRCFGEFVQFLKSARLYDDSIIIVMSDHGDALGEGLRWGHGYTVFPEVLRIPLLIHLPAAMRQRFTTDLARVSFGTDVTPTLYALLGHTPVRFRAVAGVPLFTDAAAAPPPRGAESFVVASSYGAVYGLVGRNGRRLYIADAIEGRDYLYDLRPSADDQRIGLTDAERTASRAAIREQVGELAAWYGLR